MKVAVLLQNHTVLRQNSSRLLPGTVRCRGRVPPRAVCCAGSNTGAGAAGCRCRAGLLLRAGWSETFGGGPANSSLIVFTPSLLRKSKLFLRRLVLNPNGRQTHAGAFRRQTFHSRDASSQSRPARHAASWRTHPALRRYHVPLEMYFTWRHAATARRTFHGGKSTAAKTRKFAGEP